MFREGIKPAPRHFVIDDDCVSFRGLTFFELWNGWECPWFSRAVGEGVAGYLSTESLKVRFSDEDETFMVETDGGITYLKKRQYNGEWYYGFGGIWRWDMVEKKQ